MPDMTVMVTGGAGYIGSHAVLALLDAGYRVVVIDNLVTGFAWAVDARAAFVECAVEDARVRDVIREHGVRAIMHFAGSVVVPESVGDPLKYYRNNTAASRTLIESAVAEGVPHFIFSSTAATYGTPATETVTETSPTVPINPYGMSKLMTEAMLRDVAAAHPINYAALRYFNVAGADPQGRSGQSTAGATHLIKVAVEAATGKRESVSVFGTDFDTPDGTGVRDYIHVSDLAAAHVAALDLLVAEPTRSVTLNAGYGRGFSVAQVLDAVDRVTNVKVVRVPQGRRAGDPAALISDNTAILDTLDWTPSRDDLDLIVGDALAWERKLADRGVIDAAPQSTKARVLIPFGIVTLIWGSTWLVIKDQLGVVPPSWSIAYRFLVAGLTMLAWAAYRREKIGLDARGWGFAACLALAQFCLNFNFVYRAESYVTSGLVAVVFALLLVPNAILARIFLGQRMGAQLLVGSGVAMAGVTLLFLHEARVSGSGSHAVLTGIGTTLLAVCAASTANIMQGTDTAKRYPMATMLGTAMLIGAAFDGALAFVLTGPPVFDYRAAYIFGVLYLGIFASAIAFTLYFGLIRIIGPAKAAYSGVVTPVIAMLLSTSFEGYRWSPLAAVGAVLAMAGLVIALRARRPNR